MTNSVSKSKFEDMHESRPKDFGAVKTSQLSGKRLVLASESPRRKDLLASLGIEFEIIPSAIEEAIEVGMAPDKVAIELAVRKATTVIDRLLTDCAVNEKQAQCERLLVLGADTVVVLGSDILGKPSTRQDAFQMLSRLSGKDHEVFTGVVLATFDYETKEIALKKDCERTLVTMRKLDPAEIAAYVATDEPMDKAGAYAVQGIAAAFVEKINGSISNVVGLPMTKTVSLLREAGIKILGC
jgi:septum formation protein